MSTRAESAHARYRGRLEALAGAELLLAAVAEAGTSWGWPAEQRWRRTAERFDPDEEPFATLLYETCELPQRLVRVEAFTRDPGGAGLGACVLDAGEAGTLLVTRFPSDPRLPALRTLLAGPGRRIVVRYRPSKRCTIRIDDDGRSCFAKLYADGRAERIHAAGVELWESAGRGELRFAVARPDRFDRSTRAIWQDTLVGEPIKPCLYAGGGAELAYRIGRAAASLSNARFRPRAVLDAGGELASSARHCAELSRRVPQLGDQARRLLSELEALHAAAAGTALRPVHGALHASQWLADGPRLALVDYDSLALGHPELDVATFLADVDVENRERVPVDRLNDAFVSGYEEAAGRLDGGLLRAYRAQQGLGKALRVARALRPDGDEKAARRLRRALECLGASA